MRTRGSVRPAGRSSGHGYGVWLCWWRWCFSTIYYRHKRRVLLKTRNLQPDSHVPLWGLWMDLYKLVSMVIGGGGWRCTGTRVTAVGMPHRLLNSSSSCGSSISFLLPSWASPATTTPEAASLLRSLQSSREGNDWICGHVPWASPVGAAVSTWRRTGACMDRAGQSLKPGVGDSVPAPTSALNV